MTFDINFWGSEDKPIKDVKDVQYFNNVISCDYDYNVPTMIWGGYE